MKDEAYEKGALILRCTCFYILANRDWSKDNKCAHL
jgi:hypothetical protein